MRYSLCKKERGREKKKKNLKDLQPSDPLVDFGKLQVAREADSLDIHEVFWRNDQSDRQTDDWTDLLEGTCLNGIITVKAE